MRTAVLSAGLLLGACGPDQHEAPPATSLCESGLTPITTVQGTDFQSPLNGMEVTVLGTVTRLELGTGLYMETRSGSGEASRALYVHDPSMAAALTRGTQVAVRGTVGEAGTGTDTLTSLADVTGYTTCATDLPLPLSHVALPMDAEQREALEGMRVGFKQGLAVTDVYHLAKGELTLSSDGVLQVPTEVREPGTGAQELARSNALRRIEVIAPSEPDAGVRVGAAAGPVVGIMGNDGRGQKLLLEVMRTSQAEPPAPVPPHARDHLRIVSLNLLNFFNGDGLGGGFPTERGAKTPEEFEWRKQRLRAAVSTMQPDLLGVQELENDGFGPLSAAHSLLELLNEAWGGDWAAVMPGPGPIGGDVITVGLFYRSRVVEAVGAAAVLDGPEFEGLSRHPLAQVFRDRGGNTLLVAVNHLKSKGRCPQADPNADPNADQGDGQSCWNAARVAAVEAQLPRLESLAKAAGTDRLLVIGDMNSWRLEDPVRRFQDAGLADLVARLSKALPYSYVFHGERGTLDYAFASPSVAESAAGALIWHIDADWPAGRDLPQPWLRVSDHDPVVIDLDTSQSVTSD
ncbi:MAG: ExeM/NucH family extracellular endonuclease [Lysobacterales bacterium]|jgi:hypothetical protein